MKRKTIIIFVSLVLVLGAYALLKKDNSRTIREELTDFAVENIEDIDKIRITKKDEEGTIILTKTSDNVWMINDQWEANYPNVEVLLETIRDIRVKHPVAEGAKNHVLNYMAVSGKKVEIFTNGNLKKTYYFGTTTPNMLGTYAMLEGAKSPYVVHIPRFKGYVNTRYSYKVKEWRTRNVYTIESDEIGNVSVKWAGNPDLSFSINNSNDNPVLNSESDKWAGREVNTNKVRSYLNHFEWITFTDFPHNVSQRQADSIRRLQHICEINVVDKDGASKKVTVYPKPVEKSTYTKLTEAGIELDYEVDKFFAFIDDSNEILIIQDAVFSKIMKKYSDFLLE
jgi:hypothetical protein